MSKPYIHAQSSVRKWGGKIEDYINIHNWFDESKAFIADSRHRALRHHSEGIFLCEKIFGITLTNSDGKVVSVRDVGEQHVIEDFHGFIPTVQDYLINMEITDWMVNGAGKPPSFAKIQKRRDKQKETLKEITKDVLNPSPKIYFDVSPANKPFLGELKD